MSNSHPRRYKMLGVGLAVSVMTGVAMQSLVMTQAQPTGYVQANCPAIVKQALDTVTAQCSKAGRGKVCYGNSSLTADLLPGANNITFNAPGDLADVAQIRRLTLSSMDTTANTWGIAELKIKADLPDSDPSQMVTMVMFGNTQLADASSDANLALLTQTPGAVARENQNVTATTRAINQQSTKAAATVTRITGMESTATTRASTSTATGTIPAYKATQAAATATKLANLINTVTAAPIPQTLLPGIVIGPYSGLQAFYFQSGDSALCDQAPHDGLLIQSPQGIKQRVTLNIDGATISLGSTVYMTAQPNKALTINVLEGSAVITVAGRTLSATSGMAVQVPLDVTLHPAGLPTGIPAIFYTSDAVRAMPIQTLPQTIISVPGLVPSAGTIDGLLTLSRNFVIAGNCGYLAIGATNIPVKLAVDDLAGNLWFSGTFNMVLTKSANGGYQGSESSPETLGGRIVTEILTMSLHFTDPTHLVGQLVISFTNGCTVTVPIAITLTVAPTGTPVTPVPAHALLRTWIPTNTPTSSFTPTMTLTATFTPTMTLSVLPRITNTPTLTPTPTKARGRFTPTPTLTPIIIG